MFLHSLPSGCRKYIYMCCMKRYAHSTLLFHPQPVFIDLPWSNHPSIPSIHALNPHQLACTWLRSFNKILEQYVLRQSTSIQHVSNKIKFLCVLDLLRRLVKTLWWKPGDAWSLPKPRFIVHAFIPNAR